MKFQYIKQVTNPVKGYGGIMVSTGDIVEFDGFFAGKAESNPEWKRVGDVVQDDKSEVLLAPRTKKKRGRPRKHG